ncbi:carboxypeptidase-like regulatory domain-containing protein [Sinomonas terrae]|uniref:carboxypeptidase-like regulatory domain-containing protein n=1 Tax=Sinomonas terrae TaxID=2908838 RepID=UPI00355747E2
MRRGWAAVVVLMAAACLLLSGCGGATSPGSTTTAPPPTASSSPPLPSASGTTTAPAASTPSSGTGVFGLITAGPTCPVQRADQSCPPELVPTVVQARTAAGASVASTQSDSAGRYALDLAPGSYVLVVGGAGWPRCPDTPVTVRAGSSVRADITCDTGIR